MQINHNGYEISVGVEGIAPDWRGAITIRRGGVMMYHAPNVFLTSTNLIDAEHAVLALAKTYADQHAATHLGLQ